MTEPNKLQVDEHQLHTCKVDATLKLHRYGMKGRSLYIYYILRGITMAPSVWTLIGFGLAFSLSCE